MSDKEPKLMTVKEVAEYLRLEEHTVYRMVGKGEILAFKIAAQWRYIIIPRQKTAQLFLYLPCSIHIGDKQFGQ